MKYSIFTLGALIASALGAAVDSDAKLPACSRDSPTPCQCPKGTVYGEAVTTAIIGAKAKDVEMLINDFYKIGWQGALPYKTKGPDNKVGAVRSVNYPVFPSGSEDVDERLYYYEVAKDYSTFLHKFEQVKPVPYPDGTGTFVSFYGAIGGYAPVGDETIVTFYNYACETRHFRDFAAFHEQAFQNATKILQSEGKIIGVNVAPASAQNF
ncbi:hypothetical protein F4780DRAFT_605253 [Xylariomycetidae sp. FL0641]|nr:hypothetical protein F4780DRAFT_605253 [Xylariomycetidae sp. FL0641]